MKKMMTIAVLVLLTLSSLTAQASNDRSIDEKELPAKAKLFLKTHFPDQKISLAKMERDMMTVKYEVILANSAKIEFLKNGEWKEVDCNYSVVPKAIVPPKITDQVTTRYPKATILQIDKDKHDYEVKLSNGIELKFDLKFNLIDIDR